MYKALNERLLSSGSSGFFLGQKPCSLDAMLFAHLLYQQSAPTSAPELRSQVPMNSPTFLFPPNGIYPVQLVCDIAHRAEFIRPFTVVILARNKAVIALIAVLAVSAPESPELLWKAGGYCLAQCCLTNMYSTCVMPST